MEERGAHRRLKLRKMYATGSPDMKKGGVSQALRNDGDDEVTENVDAGKTAAQLVEDG
ncbi:hypothetical protein J6TS7_02720 [Paenibacillus dendritiformis]|nr:hypothetical protein J6TS7_02720 [Paenibacillus dendritiformis]